jgi:hypothetical protein
MDFHEMTAKKRKKPKGLLFMQCNSAKSFVIEKIWAEWIGRGMFGRGMGRRPLLDLFLCRTFLCRIILASASPCILVLVAAAALGLLRFFAAISLSRSSSQCH